MSASHPSVGVSKVYHPVPKRLVVIAKGKTPPKKGGVGRRAWVICQVFKGGLCRPALNVAWCESRLVLHAKNGQYMGAWQLGEYERKRFGYGNSIWLQTLAARRYHRIAGWVPWECAPVR